MKLLFPPIVLLAIVRLASADSFRDLVQEEWNLFKLEHSKKYGGAVEESFRYKIFMQNLKKMYKHNQRYDLGVVSFRMAANEFTDMLESEVVQSRCGVNGTQLTLNPKSEKGASFLPVPNVDVPKQIDWVKLGAVTKVKNQGNCGSSWAFSVTGSLEGHNFRHTRKLISLSEQNLIDCSSNSKYGNKGCHGGMLNVALQYVTDNGINTEESYPYEAADGKQCRYKPENNGATEKRYIQLPPFKEDLLEYAVATKGPISVVIEAQQSFISYSEGIYYNSACSTSAQNVNLAVLVVGYGEENGEKYWLVKNSWGENWGWNGYIKMAKNRDNNCNIATYPLYPVM